MAPSLKLGNVVHWVGLIFNGPRRRKNGSISVPNVLFLGTLILTLVCPLAGGSALAAVFGTDDRQRVPERLKGLTLKIGVLVNTQADTLCTAFCVDHGVIATTAHCAYPKQGTAPLTRSIFKLAGASTSIAGANAPVPYVVSGSMAPNFQPPIEAARDWALIKLASPICKSGGLVLSTQHPNEAGNRPNAGAIYQAGFHRDFGDGQLVLSAPCTIATSFARVRRDAIAQDIADTGHVVLHTCDTGPASSGSPLLIDGPDGPEVVGLNAGTYVRTRASIKHKTDATQYRTDVIANTGVSVDVFRDRITDVSNHTMISTRSDLLHLQFLLAAEGVYAGPHDGVFSAECQRAIGTFERLHGYTERGAATVSILDLLQRRSLMRTNIETGSIQHHLR